MIVSLRSHILLSSAVSASATRALQAPQGSYWATYNAAASPAEARCLVAEGDKVADSCCLGTGADLVPHEALKGGDSCFSLGPGLIPFSGCVGDGVAGYGENCVTDKAPFNAADATECGCSFVLEGSGCYKANDLPGQQWFVYLDGASCEAPTPPSGSYWATYNETTGPAVDSCLVSEGDKVADSCCLGTGADLVPHEALKGGDSCFSLGPGLIPFSGCVGDGFAGYGENCVTDKAPFNAVDAAECGCSFVLEGSGCYKANDLPGQQWFVYLDGTSCKVDEATEAPADDKSGGNDVTLAALTVALCLVAGVVF
eukprot:CAMPEP_0113615354 /NCGR_PEP_ID=MMETSP0017_2-20120614/7656_1 /TAXON_ID=2856 /ORGANISM="Cylindrotheca closterium" /LENGTH=312 /DNA_ID=CAMNT_0000524585 /DNA_START=438 /DNA_END=1376 /DNA_ORIENTATION=+ /assembly_acc=CAM_ASM_000147